MPEHSPTLSIILPCLNEAETLAECIRTIRETCAKEKIDAEIIVADNGSTDASADIAIREGARVVSIDERGYGHALAGGIKASHGEFIVMGDADGSYDFREIPRFLAKLNGGFDLVMGNRFTGEILPGAMPWSHRVIGNPLLSGLGKLFFHWPIGDAHSGLRAFRRTAFDSMNLATSGMEFASEMVVKAMLRGMRITEIPITLHPDGRSGKSHLKPMRDGWRHLKFLLLFSPRWLFLYPGIFFFVLGFMVFLWLLPGPKSLFGMMFDIHTLLVAAMTVMLGFELITFALFARTFAASFGYHPHSRITERLVTFFSLEIGIVIGLLLAISGVAFIAVATIGWGEAGFEELSPQVTMRTVIPGALLFLLGLQTVFASFFLSTIGIANVIPSSPVSRPQPSRDVSRGRSTPTDTPPQSRFP